MHADRIRWGASLLLALVSAWVIAGEVPRIMLNGGLWDFGSFVASGRAAAQGLDPYGIYPLTLRVELHGFETWNPNLNPPISALLFQLFDLTEPETSVRVWRILSAGLYLAILALLFERYRTDHPLGVVLWALALAGFWDTLFLGQIYIPLVLAAVLAWLLLERGSALWAGILIGLVIAMKPNFLVWPALLFLAGHRRPALVSVGTAASVSAIPLLVFGLEIYQQWLALVATDGARAFFLTNASLAGLAARAGVPALGLPLSLALLGALALWALLRRPDPMRASAFGLLAALLASPLGWIQYTLFLLPVLLSRWHNPAIKLVGLLLIVPVPFIIDQFGKPAWTQFTIGSVYGWALVLCLVAMAVDEWRLGRERHDARAGAVDLGPVPDPA